MLVQRFMEATAIVLGAAAIALIFAPELVLARFAIEPGAAVLPLAQLYGAALFGLAITSWIARTMLLGGIYGKAVVAGGFGHALVGVFASVATFMGVASMTVPGKFATLMEPSNLMTLRAVYDAEHPVH
jgi:hypothetical protein